MDCAEGEDELNCTGIGLHLTFITCSRVGMANFFFKFNVKVFDVCSYETGSQFH